MKTLRTLRPKKSLQDDFYVFDTETGVSKNKIIEWQLRGRPENFIFGCIVGKNFRKDLWSVDEFITEFKDPRYKDKKVFAHNAEYDLNVLFGNIFLMDPTAIFNGKFICATNGVCQFADSLNIYKTSVKNIGAMLGLDKMGMDQGSYKNSDWSNNENKNRDVRACYRDCEIIYEALIRVFEDAGDIKITQASLSMTYYRRFHQPYNIDHNENTAFFFDSYFGGRTECFKMGATNASVIDVNSMYPDRMKNIQFPNPAKLKVYNRPDKNTFYNHLLKHYEGLAYCDVHHPKLTFGMLPYKEDKKLLFPCGDFSGCWNFNELRYAITRGVKIKKIDRVVYGPPMFSPFKYYVDHLYKQRFLTDNELEIYRIKIFMNSLYGKFAQRINEETIYIEDVEKSIVYIRELQAQGVLLKIQCFNDTRMDAFLILKCTKNIDVSFCIPSFASYITSAARVVLLEKLFALETKRVVYCDTDSIFFEVNDGTVETGGRLGEWKLENKIVTEIRGLKNYKYYNLSEPQKVIHRLKGVPKNAVQTGVNSFEYENLMKTKESLRRNLTPGVLTKRVKIISGIYDKRVILENGETEPFYL